MAAPQVFASPFGTAWVGFFIYAIIILAAGWFLLFFSPLILAVMKVIFNIISLPFVVVFGKKSDKKKLVRLSTWKDPVNKARIRRS